MRLIYRSTKGGKPLNMGMNAAKRVAHAADKRDQLIVLKQLGPGLPRQHHHHQELVRQRHAYYGDVYAEAERIRHEASQPASTKADNQDAGDVDRAVPESAPGSTDQ